MGIRGPKPKGELDWYRQVAELMTNEFMRFSVACQAVGVEFKTAAEEHVHEFSDEFRNLLTGMHIHYFVEIGAELSSNPSAVKDYVSGVAVRAIRELGQSGQWEKVAIPLKELSDIYGLKDVAVDTPVLGNLTQSEIDTIRKSLEDSEAGKNSQPISVIVVDKAPN